MATVTLPTFHKEHSDNVRLSSDNRVATREQGFDSGLCALSAPLSDSLPAPSAATANPNQSSSRVQLLVTHTDTKWSGGLWLGVCPSTPSRATLPANAASAAQGWAFAQVPQKAIGEGTLLTVWLDVGSRALCYESSGGGIGALDLDGDDAEKNGEVLLDDAEILDCLDAKHQLWFYIDIYGFVKQVQVLGVHISIFHFASFVEELITG